MRRAGVTAFLSASGQREPRDRTTRRRLRTIPTVLGLALVAYAGLPLWITLAAVWDLSRALRRRTATGLRLLAFGAVYLAYEVLGIARLGLLMAVTRPGSEARLAATYRIQAWWAGRLFAAARRIFGFRISVDGDLGTGPVLVLMRHASLVDTLLPAALNAGPSPLRLRYVLKRELLALPCLDIAGHILPNAFVDRGGTDSQAEVARVAALAERLGERDGVLLYPEGTRHSAARLSRALERVSQSDPARAQRLAPLRKSLPIRSGGVLALLAGAPEADVVIAMHRGLEGLTTLREIVAGGLVGCAIDVKLTRHARSELPEQDQWLDWLDARWLEVDQWVTGRSTPQS